MAALSASHLPTTCTSAKYEVPTAPAYQTITFCTVDTFENHTAVLESCCTNGTIKVSVDGCNLYCNMEVALLGSTQLCLEKNGAPSLCGNSNLTGQALPSSNSATGTATNTAATPTPSSSSKRLSRGIFALGMMALLVAVIM